jgi:hypothetical protein
MFVVEVLLDNFMSSRLSRKFKYQPHHPLLILLHLFLLHFEGNFCVLGGNVQAAKISGLRIPVVGTRNRSADGTFVRRNDTDLCAL